MPVVEEKHYCEFLCYNRRMEETKSSAVGRPRDPELERRVQEAVIELYFELGWASLTFDAVAKRAGVGKSALYLRWPTKEHLLLDALAAITLPLTFPDTGSVREDLLHFARQMFEYYLGQNGLVSLRVSLEAITRPELLASIQQQSSRQILGARAIVHRGIDRGELSPSTSATLVTDLIAGAVLNHVLATPLNLREPMLRQLDRYVEDLVDVVLAGVHYREQPSSER
jgi:AcrR family transcriptional regulator